MFSLFLSLSHPVLAKISARKRFFNFLNFFSFFFQNFLPQAEFERKSGLKFFFSFSAYLRPFSLEIIPERDFLVFCFFFYFFRNLLARDKYERNSGLNFFSLFLSLSHPVLSKISAGKRFFNFLNFFAIFFGIFFPRPSLNGNRD